MKLDIDKWHYLITSWHWFHLSH